MIDLQVYMLHRSGILEGLEAQLYRQNASNAIGYVHEKPRLPPQFDTGFGI